MTVTGKMKVFWAQLAVSESMIMGALLASRSLYDTLNEERSVGRVGPLRSGKKARGYAKIAKKFELNWNLKMANGRNGGGRSSAKHVDAG
jgi:hypothetical protein